MIGAPPVRTVTKHIVEQPGCGKLDSRNAVRRTEIANPACSLRPHRARTAALAETELRRGRFPFSARAFGITSASFQA